MEHPIEALRQVLAEWDEMKARVAAAEGRADAAQLEVNDLGRKLIMANRRAEQSWLEAHVDARIKAYRDRAYLAEGELARLRGEAS